MTRERVTLMLPAGKCEPVGMAGAIAAGCAEARAKQLSDRELETVRAELETLRRENARLGVRQPRDRAYYRREMARIQRDYGDERQPPKVVQAVELAWALFWYVVSLGFDALFESVGIGGDD